MEKLEEELALAELIEMKDEYWSKVRGETKSGSRVTIFWGERENEDTGYCFTIPTQIEGEGDVFVHVTNVDNSDGMDEAPDVWIHLYNLLKNNRVKRVIFHE